jgi:hypothetical protein
MDMGIPFAILDTFGVLLAGKADFEAQDKPEASTAVNAADLRFLVRGQADGGISWQDDLYHRSGAIRGDSQSATEGSKTFLHAFYAHTRVRLAF